MLKRSGANGAAASGRSTQASGLPWLKPEHCSTEPRVLAILAARSEQDRWNNASVLMQVRYDGKLFLWQPNEKHPAFDQLIDILDEDETKWAGSQVILFLDQDKITFRYNIRVRKMKATETGEEADGEEAATVTRRRRKQGNE